MSPLGSAACDSSPPHLDTFLKLRLKFIFCFRVSYSSYLFTLDSPNDPPIPPVKELHSTLDGKHWLIDETNRPTHRSRPPSVPPPSGLVHSRAPSKPHNFPTIRPAEIPSRVLFSNTQDTQPSPAPSSPPDSYSDPALCFEPPVSDVEVSPQLPVSLPENSFLDDFVPLGFTRSELLAGSSAVLESTASALHTTASAVHHKFAPASDSRARPSDDTSRALPVVNEGSRGIEDETPCARGDGAPRPLGHDGTRARGEDSLRRDPPLTWEQFVKMQRKYVNLQRQMY